MAINELLFQERYNELNEKQKEAVNTIYGPVMVIAGPGTGKTEVLAMRIANLLRSEAQVQPHEILCLTYTDEATNSMRRRLTNVIGTAAHRVNIGTFHSFCNNVIQANSEYFSLRNLQPITDLERTDILYEILEELPQGHVLRKLSGNIYFDTSRLNRMFDMMKRESISPESIVEAVDSYLNDLPNREEFVYKKNGKGYKAGDLKQSQIDEETKRMNITRAAALLYHVYEEKMQKAGRYDFNDMLIWVLDAFEKNPALLQSYQERHQFILVDEFQDTNGAQNKLINCLTEYWEDPNIFVVGDDDQSIYEFQGARILNIIDFYNRYKENINIVVLPHNYRSSQPILDKAAATIQNNKQRLIYQLEDLNLTKDIIASAKRFENGRESVVPVVKVYNNILQEEADIVMQIEALQRGGVNLKDVAILYAQHKQADNIIALMERKNIPYNVKKAVNILELPLVEQVINILRYLDEENKQAFGGESTLFEIIHAPYFKIAPTDIAFLSMNMQEQKSKNKAMGYWRLVLSNSLLIETMGLRTPKAIQRIGTNIEQWLRYQPELPLPLLLEKIIYESGIVAYLTETKEYTWNIQVLNTFFDFVKDVYSRNQRMKLPELLAMLERMKDENISIPVQRVVQNTNGVHFYTAHSSKGNEFEYVFLVGCTKNFWEEKKDGGNEYKLPDTLTRTEEDARKSYKEEVARRLFYVALTRAKKHLQVSYAQSDNNDKGLTPSLFVDEISTPEERIFTSLGEQEVTEHIKWALQPVPEVRIELANHEKIEAILQQLAMSYTNLSKYLRCPVSFYYEIILRVPFQKNDALAFGSAVHYALERMFRDMKEKQGEFPDKDHVMGYFKSALYREASCFTNVQFERRMEQGTTLLTDYYDEYINKFEKNVEIEFKIPRYYLDGVPVTGKIDKIELSGNNCKVIDYKTGDPAYSSSALAGPNEKEPLGGDYWRQMVFYKLIIENYEERNWNVTEGMFDYVQKDGKTGGYKQPLIPMFSSDEELVRAQLKDSYARIMNHEFDKGCGKEDCHWCNFARKYDIIRDKTDEYIEIDDL